jgi:glutathione-specific gamma-glutamylcyclotransferase
MRQGLACFSLIPAQMLLGYKRPMDDFWVFGYGSLMWNPGFAFEERRRARIDGFHRSLCIFSHAHRGTPEKPGLVLGLDEGGACDGIAYRVLPAKRDETLAYLREREQITMVYREIEHSIRFEDGGVAAAVTYVADRTHQQYAGRLLLAEQRRLVLQGVGKSGANIDYVRATQAHLRDCGIRDAWLEELTL